jgi:hypothetical protein
MKAMESEAKSYNFLVSQGEEGLEEKLKFLVSFGFT